MGELIDLAAHIEDGDGDTDDNGPFPVGVSDSPSEVLGQPSHCVVVPDFAGNRRFKLVARGSCEHVWAFNFLKSKGVFDRYCERHPTFLP